MQSASFAIEEAEVVLNLELEVAPENRQRLLEFCRRAFPIYESGGGTLMMLYEDVANPERFNEVGYYRTWSEYKQGEAAIKNDPVQSALIAEWRVLLKQPPRVSVYTKLSR